MISNCPGAQRFKQPEPEILKCPSCSGEVEIWTDEVQTTCQSCKSAIMRQEGPTCLDWCRYAKECVGDKLYNKYMKNKIITMKHKLIEELESYFGEDKKRINHAKNVMYFAEELLKKEGGDWHIIIPASILHDIGIKEAKRKYGSSALNYQEEEGSIVARGVLLKVGFKREDIDEISEIIAHHHTPGRINTQNFKILYDADSLVNLKDKIDIKNKNKVMKMIDKIFFTKTAKEVAKYIYFSV